jgi:hypothetical protein
MKAPWKQEPQPPSLTQRLSDHRRSMSLVVAGAAAAIGLGSTLYRKRRGGSTEPLNAETPPVASAPPAAPGPDGPP